MTEENSKKPFALDLFDNLRGLSVFFPAVMHLYSVG